RCRERGGAIVKNRHPKVSAGRFLHRSFLSDARRFSKAQRKLEPDHREQNEQTANTEKQVHPAATSHPECEKSGAGECDQHSCHREHSIQIARDALLRNAILPGFAFAYVLFPSALSLHMSL